MNYLSLNTEIEKINRIGQATAKKLKKLGIRIVNDLLFYFPFRYDNFGQTIPINKLRAGESANVIGRIELIQNKRSPRKRLHITEALIYDGTANLKVVWFNQPFLAKNLKTGDKISLSGRVETDYSGLSMISPSYEKLDPRNLQSLVHTQGFVPNYHLTSNLTQKQLRFLIKQIIGQADKVIDWLPKEIKQELKMLDLSQAIRKVHFPKNEADIKKSRERLAFNELFLVQLESQFLKREIKLSRAEPIIFKEKETKEFVDSLPFKLTDSQRKAAWEILRDMLEGKPMSRLLEGDVGSGKTLVAVIAMLNVVLNGKQAVLMVPTEILARQHFETINKYLGKTSRIAILTSSQFSIFPPKADPPRADNFQFSSDSDTKQKISKKFILEKINNGEIEIIIGTHALIQENVLFKNLALAIIDEQHRFGVEQRAAILSRSGTKLSPHLLSMTATPIPRSLALALYGELDISVIREMPQGRKKIITKLVEENKREFAYKFIREQIEAGRQAFVICPLIDFSDKLGIKSVEEEYKKLDKVIFPDIKIGMLHGRMKPQDKEKVMQDFLDNKTKILVSTSVVEVGVDVPNAAIMMIEGADRFGLAQIHQFRGRVGRSEHQSYCFLFTDNEAGHTKKRLVALVNCSDGFELAKIDLKFRGPGEVYGTEQKGFPELKIASLFDYNLMKLAKEQAEKIINKDPGLNLYPELKKEAEKWEKEVHLE